MQCCSANLFQFRDRLRAGFAYPRSRRCSASTPVRTRRRGDLPPYLVAAAAMESRAFPAFSYDPSAGSDWASRFDLAANPQPERDWPVHSFAYEDEAHQTVTEDVAFTLVDFVACDQRYAGHLAPGSAREVEPEHGPGGQVPGARRELDWPTRSPAC